MFGSKKEGKFAKGGHTLLDQGIEVTGDIRFSGNLDVNGSVAGDVLGVEGKDAWVCIRSTGCVTGEIRAPKIIINGRVNGDVYATKYLELAAQAEVNGNVHYSVIEMVKGAQVNGNLVHINDVEAKAKPASSAQATTKKPSDKKGAKSNLQAVGED